MRTVFETAKAALEHAEQNPLKDSYRQWVRVQRLKKLLADQEKK